MGKVMHTAGPWAVTPDNDSRQYVSAGRTIIAKTYRSGLDERGKIIETIPAESNARLIAAAPDMLEALANLTRRYVTLAGSGDCGFWDPEEENEVIAARAAISKAKF